MSARDKRYPLAALGFGLGAYAIALTRACAQRLDDAQLHASLSVAAFGFALGVFFGAGSLPETERDRRRALLWLCLASWLLPIGTWLWLRVPEPLLGGELASVAAAPLLGTPLAAAGLACARLRFAHSGAVAQSMAFGSLGASMAAVALAAIGLELVLAQAFVVVALAALYTCREPISRRFDALWSLSGAAFLFALGLTFFAQRAFAVPEEAPPFGAIARLRGELAGLGYELEAAGDRWDGFGHSEAFAIVDKKTRAKTGRGVLVRDSRLLAPLVLTKSAAPACANSLLGKAFEGHPGRVLLAGIGGGAELACALAAEPDILDVTEPSSALNRLMREPLLRLESGSPVRARVHASSIRSYVRASSTRYDRIFVSARAPKHQLPAGALPIAEALIETDRGFAQLLSALAKGGALYVLAFEEPAALRVVTTALAALRESGEQKPEEKVVIHAARDAYLVRAQTTPFSLDDLLRLHDEQRELARSPAPQRGDALDSLLWGSLIERPELVYTPGAGFQNRFGALLAKAAELEAFAHRYLFDISPASDDRPLFGEFSRHDRPLLFFVSGGALGWIAAGFPLAALVLLLLWPALVQPGRVARANRVACACLGATQVLAFAVLTHTLAIGMPRSEQSFVVCVLASGLGAASALAYAARARAHAPLAIHALALVLFALATVALGPLFGARALPLLLGPPIAFALAFLFTLAARSWHRASGPDRELGAVALGAASALPLASTVALIAGYAAVAALASALLALPTLLALRRARLG